MRKRNNNQRITGSVLINGEITIGTLYAKVRVANSGSFIFIFKGPTGNATTEELGEQ